MGHPGSRARRYVAGLLRADGAEFRVRCASALTHPVTVAALATLLLNDVVFKAIWPNAWVTGKLSDLAWVIFALPLLAFLLSFFTRGSAVAARAALLSAYVGLPVLYAAFNTFEPVHHWILWGISLVSGGMGQTPLDATDSLVIPFGVGAAAWVWQRPALSREALRLRLSLLVAGAAALASVATTLPEPDHGIVSVGISEDGAVCASEYASGECFYRSEDGGLTWAYNAGDLQSVTWGGNITETPRGSFALDGSEILHAGDSGSAQTVYSTVYLRQAGNVWVQEQATEHLDEARLATIPREIACDEGSGNVVAAMGVMGVLVGAPDGSWTPYAVGPFRPADFSLVGKAGALLSNFDFWAVALGLSMSMTLWGLRLAQGNLAEEALLFQGIVFVIAATAAAFLVGSLGTVDSFLTWSSILAWPVLIAMGIWALVRGALPRTTEADDSTPKEILAYLSLLAATEIVGAFRYREPSGTLSIIDFQDFAMFSLLSFVTIGGLLATPWHLKRHWPAALLCLAGTFALVFLAYFLWLQTDLSSWVPGVAAVALTAFAALALAGHVSAKMRARGITCPACGEWNRVTARSCSGCRGRVSY